MKLVAALLIGIVFATGLALSGMTLPSRVLGFLDVFGQWDPTLAFVMGGAVCVAWVGYRFVLRRPTPILEARFLLPTPRSVDLRLVSGAALFGIGWGLVGLCPGPALANLGSGEPGVALFVIAMVVGFKLSDWIAAAGAAGGDRRPTPSQT